MRTMKLAVSVYALTLVLGTNNALGAVGEANPSCGGNTFNLQYVSPSAGSGCSISSESTPVIYGGGFTFVTADAGKNCYTNPGYDLDGWNIYDSKDATSALSKQGLGAEVILAEPMFGDDVYPAIDSTYYIKPAWKANAITISLNRSGGTGGLSEIYREGLKLYSTFSNNTYSDEITIDKAITSLPTKAGYKFAGYFRSTYVADNYVSAIVNGTEYTNCADLGAQAWTETSGTGFTNCPWIKSDGNLASSYLPTGIAKLGTNNTEIHAGWEPVTFKVRYYRGGTNQTDTGSSCSNGVCKPGGIIGNISSLLFLPANDTISFKNTGIGPGFESVVGSWQTYTFTCRYDTNYSSEDNINYAACRGPIGDPTTTSSASFTFAGWSVSIDDGEWADGTASSEIKTFKTSQELSDALRTLTTDENATLNITAKWASAVKVVRIKSTPEATDYVSYVFAPDKGWSTYDEDTGTLGNADVFDVSALAAPKATNGIDTTFRGLAITSTLDPSIVDTTIIREWTTELPDLYDDLEVIGTFQIADNSGVWNTSHLDDVAKVINDHAAKECDNDDNCTYVIYGKWAQNCNPENDNTECSLSIGSKGQVYYVNTCKPGYNIDGLQQVGTVPVAE